MENNKSNKKSHKEKIGWREWCALPNLKIKKIEAKVDTGASTSAMHAKIISITEDNGKKYIKFKVFSDRKNSLSSKICTAELFAERFVMSSNGISEKRFIIKTRVVVGRTEFDTEIGLTDRAPLRFRMLLGRSALKRRFVIDPALAHVQGKPF